MTVRKILIVEDEFLIRLTLGEALADEGFQVLEAATGPEALDVLRTRPDVALLLTDIHLPGGLNGREVARQARGFAPALKVIFMTGRPDAMAEGGTPDEAFIAKPYLPSQVCATARRLTGF